MKILGIIIGLFLVSCSTLVEVPRAPKSVLNSNVKPIDSWGKVLKKYVDDKGRIDFVGVSNDRGDLLHYVNYAKDYGPKSDPKSFPTKQHIIAHYINSYNALSMYNVIDAEIPESLSGLGKVKFFYFRKFVIDGVEMSLYSYENDIIRKLGEERVHFALNCMSVGCPRLPRTPFTGKRLGRELQREATKFFNEERNVRVDHKEQKVFLSEILDFFPEDFLAKAPSLIHYANKYSKKKLPEKYEVDFIDYDWTINIQPGTRKKVSNLDQTATGEKS